MAKKRRTAARKSVKRNKPARRAKRKSEDTVTALVILVVIAIALVGYYLYRQNAKPKAAQLNTISTASLLLDKR